MRYALETVMPAGRVRNRDLPIYAARLRAARTRMKLSQAELGRRSRLDPKQVYRFENEEVCATLGTIKRLADALRCHHEFLIRRRIPVLHPLDPLRIPFQRWVYFANCGALEAPSADDVRKVMLDSSDPVFQQLSRPEVEALLTHLVTRGYLGIDTERRYFVLDRLDRCKYRQRAMMRAAVECACVAWSFAPKRRDRDQPTVLGNMVEQLNLLEELREQMINPTAGDDQVLTALHEFYVAEPELHIEKAARAGEMREEMELKLRGSIRIEHDRLEATVQVGEMRSKRPDFLPLIQDACEMLDDHWEFVRMADKGASISELQEHDMAHALKLVNRYEALEKLQVIIDRGQR